MTTYYSANNQMRQPLVGSSPYPVLSFNPPSSSSIQSNAMLSSPSTMEPNQSTVHININTAPPTTFASRVQSKLSAVRTWCTWYNALKTVLVLAAVSVGTVYTINVIQSTIAPPVTVGSITPICSTSNSCKSGAPLDFLVHVTVGGRDGDGETSSQVAIYRPVTVYSSTSNTTTSTTFQYLGSGKLVAAVNKAQPSPQFNVSNIINDLGSIDRDHPDVQMTGIVTLPSSPFTESIIRSMTQSGTVNSAVVMVEVQTFIRQWFKDLQFIRNQQIAISPANMIAV